MRHTHRSHRRITAQFAKWGQTTTLANDIAVVFAIFGAVLFLHYLWG